MADLKQFYWGGGCGAESTTIHPSLPFVVFFWKGYRGVEIVTSAVQDQFNITSTIVDPFVDEG